MKILTSPLRAVEQRIACALGMICLVLGATPAWTQVPATSSGEWRKLVQAKKWNEAVVALRYELRQGSQREELVEALARALVFDHRREEALALLSTAEAKEARTPQKARWIARIRVVSGLFVEDETFQIFQRGLNLWAVGDLEGARRKIDEAWAREPDHGGILIRQGQLALLMKKPGLAVEKLRQSRTYNPFEPQALLWLADALEATHDLSGARDAFAQYRKQVPRSEIPSARGLLLEYRLRSAENTEAALAWIKVQARKMNASAPWSALPLWLVWLESQSASDADRALVAQLEQVLRRPAVTRSFGFGENFAVLELPSEQRISEWRARLNAFSKISSTP